MRTRDSSQGGYLPHRHTLLACGKSYAVLGAPDGKTIIGAALWAVNSLRAHLRQPIRVPAPPESVPLVGGYRIIVTPSLPPEVNLIFEYRTEELTGITIYSAFYGGDWYVREIRGTGGQYFRLEEGGAEWKKNQAEADEWARQISES